MRRGIRKALALVGSLALTLGMCASALAADKPDIKLDGGEEGASKMIGTFTGPSSKGKVTDDYKYLGYASFLDLADKDYRYLKITYTGNITQFRIQMVHDAGKSSEEIDPVKYWFNQEVVVDSQNKPLVTKDGSAIPLEGKNTTVVIDLKNSGVDMSFYNSGLHMHCDLMKQYGDFTISDAYLVADDGTEVKVSDPKGTSASKNNDKGTSGGNSGNTNGGTGSDSGTGTSAGTSTGSTGAPATGSATYPIALGFGGIALAGVALIASRRFKEEN